MSFENEKDIAVLEGVHEVEGDVARPRQEFTYADAKRFKRMADWRIVPVLFFAYLMKNMDTNMASYVKAMNTGTSSNILTQLNMSANAFSYASTAYYVPFALLEVPSNLLLQWTTPRIHLTRIFTAWSIICICTAACTSGAGFLVCRAFLGAAEAGFYPGLLYLLNCWYRPDEVAVRVVGINLLGQFSGVFDTLIAYGFSYVDDKLAGWRWCYLVCGLLSLLVCVVMFFTLPDYPDSPPSSRQFLSPEEGAFMASRLPPSSSSVNDKHFDWPAIRQELKSPLVYLYGFMIHTLSVGLTGLNFWLPTIIAAFKLTSTTQSLLLNAPPSILYVIVAILTAIWLDNDTRVPRFPVLLICCLWLMACFIALIYVKDNASLYALILITYIPYAIYYSSIMPLRNQSLNGKSAAISLAIVNTIAQLPGVYSAQIFRTKYAPRYVVPFAVCTVFLGLSGLIVAITWYLCGDLERQTRLVARARRAEGKESNAVALVEVDQGDGGKA